MSTRRCTYCREYFDGSSMVVRGLSAFCSNAHLTLHASSSRPSSGPKAPRNRRNSMTEERRIEVLVLDHYRCRYCGDPSRDLAVHHISYRSEASKEPWLNQVHNLITLCNYPCHLDIVHGNKKLYQPLCRQIVWLRAMDNYDRTTIKSLEKELK